LQFKATQNCRGSNGEVTLNFITRRRYSDKVIAGDGVEECFLFAGTSRAHLRQHVFVEDLRKHEVLPVCCRAEGILLGLEPRQFSATSKAAIMDAASRQSLRYLRLLKECEKVLRTSFRMTEADAKQRVSPRWNSVLPTCFGSSSYLAMIQHESLVARRVGNRVNWGAAQALLQYCRDAYDKMLWSDVEVRIPFLSSYRARDLFAGSSASRKLWDSVVDKASEPPPAKHLQDFSRYEAEHASFEAAVWQHVAIPTLTVHLTQLDTLDDGFHKALVMVPVCTSLLKRWLDPNDLIAELSRQALNRYLATSRGQWVKERGVVEPGVGHHKQFEVELGGHRYVVSACHSDRPAFIMKLKSAELGDMELLHFYCAMGLSKQKKDQQALLARVADFELAQAVVATARDLLNIKRVNTRAIAKDTEVKDRQLRLWVSRCGHPVVEPSRLMQVHGSLCEFVWPSGTVAYADTKRFLKTLGANSEWLALVEEVDAILARVSSTTGLGRVTVAPKVRYLHESRNCQTPPAEVVLPDIFTGRLLWGGLSHGMSKDWLLYENVKLVVNCINTVSAGGEPNLLWQDSVKVRGEVSNEITFIDFCVNYAGDQRQYVKTFAAICAILDRGDCVYIHCLSGKDRSAFTVFALLQLQYNIDEDTARAALATRIGCDGRCIANVDVGHEANWKWLTSQLRALGRPVTGV